jgi:hypothetical protein
MLSDVLSRLAETVGEQTDDMQGYVTEIMLTLQVGVVHMEVTFPFNDASLSYARSVVAGRRARFVHGAHMSGGISAGQPAHRPRRLTDAHEKHQLHYRSVATQSSRRSQG